jgi:DUF4097 and DUF4098 domain-containing protein YvlB
MEMTMKKPLMSALTLGAALLATQAWADDFRKVDERRPLKPNGSVSISNVAGKIDVEAWDKNELHLTGEISSEVEELEITGSESAIRIEVRLPDRARNVGDTRLLLKVPAGASLDAAGVSADIRVKGLRGKVKAESVSGDIDLDIESREVKAQSVSGDVTLRAPSENTRVESVSGDVTVSGGKGELRGESVSGSLKLQLRDVKMLDVETVSGDIDLDLELASRAEVEVETLSGELTLVLPALPDFDVDLETFSGSLESTLLPDLRRRKEYEREGKQPGHLQLHSFSGDIVIRKK